MRFASVLGVFLVVMSFGVSQMDTDFGGLTADFEESKDGADGWDADVNFYDDDVHPSNSGSFFLGSPVANNCLDLTAFAGKTFACNSGSVVDSLSVNGKTYGGSGGKQKFSFVVSSSGVTINQIEVRQWSDSGNVLSFLNVTNDGKSYSCGIANGGASALYTNSGTYELFQICTTPSLVNGVSWYPRVVIGSTYTVGGEELASVTPTDVSYGYGDTISFYGDHEICYGFTVTHGNASTPYGGTGGKAQITFNVNDYGVRFTTIQSRRYGTNADPRITFLEILADGRVQQCGMNWKNSTSWSPNVGTGFEIEQVSTYGNMMLDLSLYVRQKK